MSMIPQAVLDAIGAFLDRDSQAIKHDLDIFTLSVAAITAMIALLGQI